MKKIFTNFLFLIITFIATAQTQAPPSLKLPALDKSPMDMSYFPNNYPVLKIQDKATEPLIARVIYSRPQKDNRIIFGDLIEYNTVWRMGANEATEIEFFRDVKIANKKITKGRYTIYAIPTEMQWTIILNKDTDIWGAFKYDSTKDVVRTVVPVEKAPDTIEAFTITFNKIVDGITLVIAWDNVSATLPIIIK